MNEAGLPPEVARRVAGWRAAHRHVYLAEIGGDVYVFRALRMEEFRELRERYETSPSAFMDIVDAALLWPEKLPDDCLAGIPSVLADQILDISGFGQDVAFDTALSWARQEVTTKADYAAMALICKAFPYRVEDLEKKTFLELMTLLAMAEQVTGATLGVGGEQPPALEDGIEMPDMNDRRKVNLAEEMNIIERG